MFGFSGFFSWQLTENLTDVTGVEEGREIDGAKRKRIWGYHKEGHIQIYLYVGGVVGV